MAAILEMPQYVAVAYQKNIIYALIVNLVQSLQF